MAVQNDPYASYKLLARELQRRGYHTTEDTDSRPKTISYHHPVRGTWKTPMSYIQYPFVSEDTRRLAVDKAAMHDRMEAHQLPVPYTRRVSEVDILSESVMAELFDHYKTLVVKPLKGSLSRGVSLNIQTPRQLQAAIQAARLVYPEVLIQQQLEGEEIRFAVLDGQVQAALLRRTPRVEGDGSSSIATLIEGENKQRATLTDLYVQYPQLSEAIIEGRWMEDETILAPGQRQELNRSTMIKGGCSVYDVLSSVDQSYVTLAQEIAEVMGGGFLAVDIFVQDYHQPYSDNAWLIECNSSPVLKLFYAGRDRKIVDIVPRLADCIDHYFKQQNRLT